MSDLTVAKNILEQLGGNKFLAMTGAHNLVAGEGSLRFALPRHFGGTQANLVEIKLEASDTYTVRFSRYWGRSLKTLLMAEATNVYAADLRKVFTQNTGLDTSL